MQFQPLGSLPLAKKRPAAGGLAFVPLGAGQSTSSQRQNAPVFVPTRSYRDSSGASVSSRSTFVPLKRSWAAAALGQRETQPFPRAGGSAVTQQQQSAEGLSGSSKAPLAPTKVEKTKRKMTAAKTQLIQRVHTRPREEVIARLDDKIAAAGKRTRDFYSSSYAPYELFCEERRPPVEPLPLDEAIVYEFFAYVGDEGLLWQSPIALLVAMKDAHRLAGRPAWKSDKVEKAVDVLQGEREAKEESHPIGGDMIVAAAPHASGEEQERVVLTMAGAFFATSRCEAFRYIRAGSIVCSGAGAKGKAKVSCTHLKGRPVKYKLDLNYEELPGKAHQLKLGGRKVDFTPVSVFSEIRRRLAARAGPLFGKEDWTQQTYNTKLNDAVDTALASAGYETRLPGRTRKVFTSHGLRSGGVCALLRAGLAKTVIVGIADWESDMIQTYARRCVLDPSIVPAMAFYNPVSLKHNYGSCDDGDGPCTAKAKKRKTR